MGKIIIKDIEVDCNIGVTREERSRKQTLWLSLEMDCDVGRAAMSDDIADAIDYDKLTRSIREWASAGEWCLVERFCVEAAELVLSEGGVFAVTAETKKRAVPGTDYIAVRVRRER
ncbi:MAG: dihydroneopterin aldolase [Verrucomicrobia bacterium]|nr:dihydroneopterin aldolase [Verrucomicrobiota bacterium]MCF7708319.1 dihydroneopterin aldolase [Verrucomicrobiota bacterium]